ncbi:MAG: methyltransferase domain-containing protein [Planctomycetes bacterium]|nr:methyltransferase domain-containing protein [Planctomycetota bacterium]
MKFEPATPAEHLLDILGGKARLQAVSTAAALGVPDLLLLGPKTVVELAAMLDCREAVLLPVLRLTAGLGFFDCPEPGRYALTDRGRVLCRDRLGALAAFAGAPEQWDPWSRLRVAARGGQVPFVQTFGRSLYEFVAGDAAAGARYDAAIDAYTRHEAEALCEVADLTDAHAVLDVGGGQGTLLRAVLRRWPELRGVLFDLPSVVARALPSLRAEFGDRVHGEGGDFFAALPRGADVLLLKHVLHNWDDERALALLRCCAAALPTGGRLLLIETLLAPDQRPDGAAMLDLEMAVLLGGRERRKPELRRLLAEAGFELAATNALGGGAWLLVGRVRGAGG